MNPLKIAIGVGGRFHADRMADALLQLGHQPTLFSTLPKFRFSSLPAGVVKSSPWPELVFRVSRSLGQERFGSDFKMVTFGRILANKLKEEPWDIFVGWSSFSKEALEQKVAKKNILIRDSTHISFQMDILETEYKKIGISFQRDELAESREIKEYELADEIIVLSNFAKNTFLSRGVPSEKIKVVRLGVDTSLFFPLEHREWKAPLRVVYFGSMDVRKGIPYLLQAIQQLESQNIEFHLVGSLDPKVQHLVDGVKKCTFYPSMPQHQLAGFLRTMDVFVFPTLEDGFGQTLIQAMASGLVPIFTPNCGAAELVSEGEGIQVRAGNSDDLVKTLSAFVRQPDLLKSMRKSAIAKSKQIGWETYTHQLADQLLKRNSS